MSNLDHQSGAAQLQQLLFSPLESASAKTPRGIYSVCSSHPLVLGAAMQVAKRVNSPLLIEATSNQVDQFGGYTGLTPLMFRQFVMDLCVQENFPFSRVILGGDHLGPNAWQHLSADEAMAHACILIERYVQAGFQKIHLDCSMACASDQAPLSDEVVAERAAKLAAVSEATCQKHQLVPPIYVIGTEVPVPGGEVAMGGQGVKVTSATAAAHTLATHQRVFQNKNLSVAWERVVAMVVQPGVDFDHWQIQDYDPELAQTLSNWIESKQNLVFEAHSTDYQTPTALAQLVKNHFAILKVGPALTFAMREAIFSLAAIESILRPENERSHLLRTLDEAMQQNPKHWQKYHHGSPIELQALRHYALSDRIRYYWQLEPIKTALGSLMDFIDQATVPLSLWHQFFPLQYDELRVNKDNQCAANIIKNHIAQALSPYALACEFCAHPPSF